MLHECYSHAGTGNDAAVASVTLRILMHAKAFAKVGLMKVD